MTRIKLDQEIIGLSRLIEKITKAHVKDCFQDQDVLYVIVAPGQVGKAIGKKAANVKRLQTELGKKVRIIEYSDDIEIFIKNIIAPVTVETIEVDDQVVYIKDSQKKTKSLLIGRGGRNLNTLKRAVRRFFNVDIKVM